MRVFAVLALFCASTAQAGLIHQYSFSIGTGETGTFSYDAADHYGQVLGLEFKSFDFDFMGVKFDETDMLFGSVYINEDGMLDQDWAGFWGSNCNPGTCTTHSQTSSPGSTDILFQFFGFNLPGHGTQNFSHGFGSQTEATSLSLSYLGVKQVPEPATLLLLGLFALRRLYTGST